MNSIVFRFLSILITALAIKLPEQMFFMLFWSILFAHNSLSFYKNWSSKNYQVLALSFGLTAALVYFYSIKAILFLFCLHHGFNDSFNIKFKNEMMYSKVLRFIFGILWFSFMCANYSSFAFVRNLPQVEILISVWVVILVMNIKNLKVAIFELLMLLVFVFITQRVQYFEYIVFYHLILWLFIMNTDKVKSFRKENISFVALTILYVAVVFCLFWPFKGFADSQLASLKIFNSVYGIYHIVFTFWLSKNLFLKNMGMNRV